MQIVITLWDSPSSTWRSITLLRRASNRRVPIMGTRLPCRPHGLHIYIETRPNRLSSEAKNGLSPPTIFLCWFILLVSTVQVFLHKVAQQRRWWLQEVSILYQQKLPPPMCLYALDVSRRGPAEEKLKPKYIDWLEQYKGKETARVYYKDLPNNYRPSQQLQTNLPSECAQ